MQTAPHLSKPDPSCVRSSQLLHHEERSLKVCPSPSETGAGGSKPGYEYADMSRVVLTFESKAAAKASWEEVRLLSRRAPEDHMSE